MDQELHARLRKALHYDAETGDFRWVDARGRGLAGALAGHVMRRRNTSYRYIEFEQRSYMAHRLAWFYVKGVWPKDMIDHIDGDGLNNRYANLREATNGQNQQNSRLPVTNKSGYKGVVWVPRLRKWQASIGSGGRNRYLGVFPTPEEAYQAYCNAAVELHGEYARFD